jgi:hypothetical protein
MIDPNTFKEYKKGHYRCASCRKYLKLSKWVCSHTHKCQAKYLFKCEFSKKVPGNYEEETIEEHIDKIFEKHEKFHRQDLLNRINKILGLK